MKVIIMTGPPYSGKGTQCDLLEQRLHYKPISTGDLCRAEKEKGTKEGKIIAQYDTEGKLVPDDLIKWLFQNALDDNKDEKGIILDGYPRTKVQVDHLMELLNERNLTLGKVVNIEVPTSELLKRAGIRAETSKRADDKDAATRQKQIEVFENQTKPAIEYLKTKTKVIDIDGMGPVEEITERILAFF